MRVRTGLRGSVIARRASVRVIIIRAPENFVRTLSISAAAAVAAAGQRISALIRGVDDGRKREICSGDDTL